MSDHEYFEQLCAISVDGTLTDSEREKLEAHLSECPSCAALKQDLEQMQALFEEEVALPASLHQNIMEKLEQQQMLRVVRPEKPVRRLPVFSMLAAAAVVVIVVLGGGIGQIFSMGSGAVSGGAEAAADTASANGAAAGSSDMAMRIERAAADAGTDAAGAAADMDGAAYSADPAAPQAAAGPEIRMGDNAQEEAETDSAAAAGAGVNATKAAGILLPESLKGKAAAHCYVAYGTGELPDMEGELLADEGGAAFFSLPNSMSTIENTLAAVEQAGYEVTAYDGVGLTIDSKADSWILIVVTK